MSRLLNHLNKTERTELLDKGEYRDFLKYFIKPHSSLLNALSYAEFSRRAGFSSRAFPRDICLGTRAINLETLPKFIRGLGLTGDWKEYFTILVQKEINSTLLQDKNKAEKKLESLKQRLLSGRTRINKINDLNLANRAYAIPELPRIFAALGSVDKGSTIDEISLRLKIKTEELRPRLQAMEKLGFVQFNESTCSFLPQTHHHTLSQVGGSDFFKYHFIQSTQSLLAQAKNSFISDTKLFLQTSFSVSSEDKLKQLKSEMRELIFKFVDENEDSNGTIVVDLALGMFDPTTK